METNNFSDYMKVAHGIWAFHKWNSVSKRCCFAVVGSGLLDIVLKVSGGVWWYYGCGSGPGIGMSVMEIVWCLW